MAEFKFESIRAAVFLSFAFALVSTAGVSQVAMVVNPTTLYAKASKESEALDRLEVGFAIYIYEWDADIDEEWHIVEYDTDTFSRARVDTSVTPTRYKGYIAKEDLWFIGDLMTPDHVNLLEYTSEFDSSGHQVVSIMKNWDDYSYLDEPHWGTDGNLPDTQVDSLIFIYHGDRMSVPKHLVSDVYQTTTNDYSAAYYPPFYIFTKTCSDGAGAYEMTWVFREEELVQRLLVVPF